MNDPEDLPLWTTANLRRTGRHLWMTLCSLSGMLDVLGTVIVGFVLGKIPALDGIDDMPLFTPIVVALGGALFVLLASLRATARIAHLEAREAERENDYARKITSLQGDLNDLHSQCRQMQAGKRDNLRTIDARWPGFEHLWPLLDEANGMVVEINSASAGARLGALARNADNLGSICKTALNKLQDMKGARS